MPPFTSLLRFGWGVNMLVTRLAPAVSMRAKVQPLEDGTPAEVYFNFGAFVIPDSGRLVVCLFADFFAASARFRSWWRRSWNCWSDACFFMVQSPIARENKPFLAPFDPSAAKCSGRLRRNSWTDPR